MGEHDQRGVGGDLRQVLLQPLALRIADLEAALDAVVESGDGVHALLRRHAARRPEVLLHHALQDDEVHTLRVEGVGFLPEQHAPLVTQVEIPVVLAHHHVDGRLQVLQDLRAELELLGSSELRQIAAEQHEVGRRIEAVDVVDRAQQLAHEAVVELASVEMRVGDVGEREGLDLPGGRVGHRHGLEGMGMEARTAPDRGGGRRQGHLQEAAAVQPAQPLQERVALLVVLRLDAGVPAHGYLPPLPGPPAARSSNGRTLRMPARCPGTAAA